MNNLEESTTDYVILQKFINLEFIKISFSDTNNSGFLFAQPLISYLLIQKYITHRNIFNLLILICRIILSPFLFLLFGVIFASINSNIQYLYYIFCIYLFIEFFILGYLLQNHIVKRVYLSENWFDALYENEIIVIDSTRNIRQINKDMELKHQLRYPINWRERLKSLIEEGVLPAVQY